MNQIGKALLLLAHCLPSLVVGSGTRHSFYLDTQVRLGYSLAIAEWLDVGSAGRIYYQGLSTWRPNAGPGEFLGSVDIESHLSLLLPVVDLHPTWSGMEVGCRTYAVINDVKADGDQIGEWIRSDLYLAYPMVLKRLEFVPSAYLLKYGYSLDKEFHEFGYGLLLEGRVAFRF